MKANLTKTWLERQPPPTSGRLTVQDERTPGLAVTITSSGTKSFYVYRRIGGRPTRMFLGRLALARRQRLPRRFRDSRFSRGRSRRYNSPPT